MLKVSNTASDNIIKHLNKLGLYNDQSKSQQIYTLDHKQAFMAVQTELLGENTRSGLLHDTDKLIEYALMPRQKVYNLHEKYAWHHIPNHRNGSDRLDCIVDFESARFTKVGMQLNAYKTIKRYFPSEYSNLLEQLKWLGLDTNENKQYTFEDWNKTLGLIENIISDSTIKIIDYIWKRSKSIGIESAVKEFYDTEGKKITGINWSRYKKYIKG